MKKVAHRNGSNQGTMSKFVTKITEKTVAAFLFFFLILLSSCADRTSSYRHDCCNTDSIENSKKSNNVFLSRVFSGKTRLKLVTPESFGIKIGMTNIKEVAKKFKILAIKACYLGKNYREVLFLIESVGRNIPVVDVVYNRKSGVVKGTSFVYPNEPGTPEKLRSELSKKFKIDPVVQRYHVSSYRVSNKMGAVLSCNENPNGIVALVYLDLAIFDDPEVIELVKKNYKKLIHQKIRMGDNSCKIKKN